jgi:hypothetical protein
LPTFQISVFAEKDTLRYMHDAADMETCIHAAREHYQPREHGEVLLIKVHPPHDWKQLQDYMLDETRAVGLAWLPGEDHAGEYRPFVVDLEPPPGPAADSARVRDAAPELLHALEQAREALTAAPRFDVPGLESDSYAIAANCDHAIAKAKGRLVEPKQPCPQRAPERDGPDFDL